jgi:hypothetical protein
MTMMKPYDGVVIDPFWVDIAGRGDKVKFHEGFYRACCRASPVFQLGDWKRRRRAAEARNDFDALDMLDREYEMIGV